MIITNSTINEIFLEKLYQPVVLPTYIKINDFSTCIKKHIIKYT